MGVDTEKVTGLRWRGVLADASVLLRRIVAGGMVLACLTAIFTQWGYVGYQFASGAVSYLMFMLIPVAMGAMLLGTLPGVAVGAFLGTTLFAHAMLSPLDYYEFTYVTPVTAIVLPALCGLLLGLFFSMVLSRREAGESCRLGLILACFGASCVYSIICYLSTRNLAYAAQEFTVGAAVVQALGDTAILAIASLPVFELVDRKFHGVGGTGLNFVFGAWLFALVLVAYMAVVNLSYGQVTNREYGAATTKIRDEVEFVRDQVLLLAPHDGEHDSLDGDTSSSLLNNLFAGYTEDADGLLVVSHEGTVVGADAERIAVGQTLEEIFDKDVLAAIDKSAAEDSLECVIYLGPSATSDFGDVVLHDTEEIFANMLTRQVGYLMAEEKDGYKFILIRPTNMVFAGRDDVMGWVFFSSLVLLVVVYALVWELLKLMVARHIETTNAVLERITEGDLESRVEPSGTLEFLSLSKGINTTVDTLKGWITEAESHMDAELATAKAIQESALPNVYPPYPDIRRFDIYGSMNAAKEVGGDFYDFFLVGDDCGPNSGKLAFVMADVSGKGVPAALFMMKAKTQIHDYLEAGMELGEAVENANHQLCEGNEEGMFVTAWIGILDYATRHVDFVNAGHNPPLLWKGDSWVWVKQRSGLPLGLFDEMPYRTHSIDCMVGDQFLLYTDGVTEAFSVDEEQYGEMRLERLVNECNDLHPRELVSRVRHSVAVFAQGADQSDDITILALEVGVPPEEKAQLLVMAEIGEINRVMDFLIGELDRRLCPVRVQHQLEVAVEELFVNQCRYAYEGMGPGVERYVRVTYSYKANPKSLTVELIDDGAPFDPLAKPDADKARAGMNLHELPIGGLGILMAKKNVDEMRYERVDDSNIVTLVKYW